MRRRAFVNLAGFPHGTVSGYRRGCSCADCRAANAASQRTYQERRRRRDEASTNGRDPESPFAEFWRAYDARSVDG